MNTLALLAINLVTLLQGWIVSLRRSLTIKSLGLFFLVGFFGTTLVTFVLHFLATRLWNPAVVAYTVNPLVEESIKIAPVLIFLWLYRTACRQMGILDIMLLALAAGTGFEVGESLLYVLGHTPRQYSPSLWLLQRTPYNDYYFTWFKQSLKFVFAGHGVLTAAIGAGIGFAVYLKTVPRLANYALFIPGVVFLWAVYDHAMVNYLLSKTFLGTVTVKLNPLLQITYFLDRAGRLIITVFTLSIFLALYLEERLITAQLGSLSAFRLAEEKSPVVLLGEFQALLATIRHGWKYLRELLAFFGLRRQLAYLSFFSRFSQSTKDSKQAAQLHGLIQQKLDWLQEQGQTPDPDAWNYTKLWKDFWHTRLAWFKRPTLNDGLTVALILLWIVLFVVQPAAWKREQWFYNLVMILAVAGAMRTVMMYVRFLRAPRPDEAALEANAAVAHFSARALAHLSLALVVVAVGAHFLPWVKVVNDWHVYFLWNAFHKFYNTWGTYLPGMLAINAGLLALIPELLFPPKPLPQPPRIPTPTTPSRNDKVDSGSSMLKEAIMKALNQPTTPEKILSDGTKEPHCNFFASDVAENLGISDLLKPDKTPMLAAEQYDFISLSGSWREVSPHEAQDLANKGKFVLGLTPADSSGHGHSTVVAPGYEMAYSGTNQEYVPWVYDINLENPAEPRKASLSYIYHDNRPRWFTPNE